MTLSLDEINAALTQQPVRDLAWVLLSPPLLDEGWQQRHPLSASAWWASPDLLADWLRQLDRQPAPLQDWLARHSIRRLGLYYERLWQFALLNAPGVELLAANLPVRQAGHTLGELDLLLRDAEGVFHLELAVKFYLGLAGDGQAHDRWLGPDSQDRLDLKIAHLCQRQLPLGNAAPTVNCWPKSPARRCTAVSGSAATCFALARRRARPSGGTSRTPGRPLASPQRLAALLRAAAVVALAAAAARQLARTCAPDRREAATRARSGSLAPRPRVARTDARASCAG